MLRQAAAAVLLLAAVGGAGAWFLTEPRPLDAAALPDHAPDVANGERIFYVSGCSSCHAAPGAEGEDKLRLGGGLELNTDFGVFRAPNISPDPATGIGGWTDADFVNAVTRGISPRGTHYYPAFPYPSYARMHVEDVLDLKAYLATLPAVSNRVAGHVLKFPFNIRRAVGLWKRLYLSARPVVALQSASDQVKLGQYLVEGPGHCGECHTARTFLGGLKTDLWLAGAPNPEGRGTVPNITPGALNWSESEIVDTFKTGFTPDFDTLGSSMGEVQENLSQLADADLAAIAAYLKAIPSLPDAVPAAAAQ